MAAFATPGSALKRLVLASLGEKCRLDRRVEWRSPHLIALGDRVVVQEGCALRPMSAHPRDREVKIRLASRVVLVHHVYISAAQSVSIGEYSGIGPYTQITDFDHEYNTPFPPYVYRPFMPPRPVTIGRNVWLGQGCFVFPGVSIGDGAIVGAYGVVRQDVPPFCVAVGQPARVIKAFDFEKKVWVRSDGTNLPPAPSWEELVARSGPEGTTHEKPAP